MAMHKLSDHLPPSSTYITISHPVSGSILYQLQCGVTFKVIELVWSSQYDSSSDEW